jgi:hypothetical protein
MVRGVRPRGGLGLNEGKGIYERIVDQVSARGVDYGRIGIVGTEGLRDQS